MSDGKLLELGRCEEPSYGVPYEGVLHDASGCNSGVECLLPKQDVVGSNPITRSNRTIQAFPHQYCIIPPLAKRRYRPTLD